MANRGAAYHIIALGVGVAIVLLLVQYAGTERVYASLLKASPYWIAASVFIYAVSWIFRTLRLKALTDHAGKRLALPDLFKLYISGFALNILLPAKLGDIITIGYLKMRGIPLGKSAAIIVQTRILDLLAIVVLSIPATILVQSRTPDWVTTSIILSALLFSIPLGLTLLDRSRFVSKKLREFGARAGHKLLKLLLEKLGDAYDAYHELVGDRKVLALSVLFSLAIWLFDGLTCQAMAISLGAQISFPLVMFAVAVANIGKTAPATPGSLGIYEGILAAVLTLFGVPFEAAVLIAVLDHAVKNIFTLLFGIPATTNMGFGVSKLYEDLQGRKGIFSK